MIPRLIQKPLETALAGPRKVVLLLGARQVGKTTVLGFIRQSLEARGHTTLYLNADIAEDVGRINTFSLTTLSRLTRGTDYLLIDEAQRLDDPGRTLKIIHDHLPTVRVVATGSSSLDLKNKLSDPLTGRVVELTIYPFSLSEQLPDLVRERADYVASEMMLYGGYPEVVTTSDPKEKERILGKLIDGYLYKDVLAFQRVREPQVLMDLSRALAYQIGAEVNENELGSRLKIDRKTVLAYIDLLVKTFVLLRLFPFSKNPRREIGRNYKLYFVDLGVRNALIGDFNALDLRADVGAMWENFLVMERLKRFAQRGEAIQYHFWRTYGGAEIDWLERETSRPDMQAFEFKYGKGRVSRGARLFSRTYHIPVTLVNRENYVTFVG